MFTKPLEYIFLPSALKSAYEEINKNASGIDEIHFKEFEKEFDEKINKLSNKLLKGEFSPEPLKQIEIEKTDSDEKRPIALSAIKDKIVQKVLYNNLNPYFENKFNDKSYAYRPDKSTMKALNRVTDYINKKYFHILKSDIDNFFETIDHDILLNLLETEIADKKILKLISLFLKTGGFKNMEYDDHLQGVHQGDILSPLLSNIYLNQMDIFLEKEQLVFVRYADDFVLLFQKKNDAYKVLKKLKEFLKTLKLSLKESKTKIVHISEGFTFLGISFIGRNRFVAEQRIVRTLQKIKSIANTSAGFYTYSENINSYLRSLKNYYLKIIPEHNQQHLMLQNALIESVSHKVYLSKTNKTVKTKKVFKNFISEIRFEILFDKTEANSARELALAKGYEEYKANKSYKASTKIINKKKNIYAKKFANEATLHISTPGLMLGISKNKFVVKEYGRVKERYPLNRVQRIILEGKGFTISSDVFKKCAQNNIGIDFIDTKAFPYATFTSYNAASTQIYTKQSLLLQTKTHILLAQAFIKGKAKNQLNYLKYMNKYHKILDKEINTMQKNFLKIKTAESIESLMGIEGAISASYWNGVRLLLEVPFEKRITQGARDIVNSSLNYAYAILYGEVQRALLTAGLSLNISFLHTLDGNKPTLTFDMIEEFRTFIVDRVLISMLNKDEPLKLGTDGLLTKTSRQLLSRNIKEKLGSYTMWKKESRKVKNIIQTQAYLLAKVVKGEEKKYKPFIGKF
ncbi:CRISPR-associated endonuclease Cas1 [Sulfurimonas sp. NWX367]|uniref:CRISPR-associated endonuclease Cas1 n=1 Tax=Sulfurimonas sp. NWX367 TaxID=2925413 RepID=UPI003204DDE2